MTTVCKRCCNDACMHARTQTLDMVREMVLELWDQLPSARLTAQATSERLKKFRLIKFFDEKIRDSGYENEVLQSLYLKVT